MGHGLLKSSECWTQRWEFASRRAQFVCLYWNQQLSIKIVMSEYEQTINCTPLRTRCPQKILQNINCCCFSKKLTNLLLTSSRADVSTFPATFVATALTTVAESSRVTAFSASDASTSFVPSILFWESCTASDCCTGLSFMNLKGEHTTPHKNHIHNFQLLTS